MMQRLTAIFQAIDAVAPDAGCYNTDTMLLLT
jgi:hypothetical protein